MMIIIRIDIYLFSMISTQRALSMVMGRGLRNVPMFRMNHIKNMREENIRVEAEQIQNSPMISETDRVYKPTYTIEFNREGEVLLYSGNPINSSTLYFKYPYVFCTLHIEHR